jgi:hypothetical protein
VNLTEIEEEDRCHQLMGAMFALEPAVTTWVRVEWRCLTARTSSSMTLGTQRGRLIRCHSNSVRVMNKLHYLADGGPAAAAVLSPRTFQPPTYMKKMIDAMKPARIGYDKKSAAGMYTKKAVMVYEFATDKTITAEGGHALLKPMLCIGGGDVVVTRLKRLAMNVSVGGQSQQGKYKTDRKMKLLQLCSGFGGPFDEWC